MSLLPELTRRIDDFCGQDQLVKKIDHCSAMVATEHVEYFDNVVLFINEIYNNPNYPVEEKTIRYKKVTLKTIEIFHKYSKDLDCETLQFVVSLLNYKLETVTGVKLLLVG